MSHRDGIEAFFEQDMPVTSDVKLAALQDFHATRAEYLRQGGRDGHGSFGTPWPVSGRSMIEVLDRAIFELREQLRAARVGSRPNEV